MERARDTENDLRQQFGTVGSYVVPMGYLVRFRLELNAREAMHLLELRSQASGHPHYRTVAQEMHRAIRNIAGHRRVAEAMSYVDHGDYVVGRVDAERNAEANRSRVN
jgi:thymidylate synthase ThyX